MIGPTPRTAEQGIEGMERAHHHVRASAPKSRVFVDQFNFVMREENVQAVPALREFRIEALSRRLGRLVRPSDDRLRDVELCRLHDGYHFQRHFPAGHGGVAVCRRSDIGRGESGARVVTMADGSSMKASNIKHYAPWPTDGWLVIEAALEP